MADTSGYVAPVPLPGNTLEGPETESIPSGEGYGGYVAPVPLDEPATENLIAAGQGAIGGLTESTGVLGGMIAGARVGAVAGPKTAIAGAIIGGGVGYFGGHEAREQLSEIEIGGTPLTTASIRDIPEELRPYAVAGEAFGGSLPFMVAPFAAAKMGYQIQSTSFIGNWLNKVIQTAKTSPKAFAASEISAAASSALAGGAMEDIAPGNIPARIGAEITAGVLNPTRLAIGASKSAINLTKKVYQAVSPTAQETAASAWLRGVVELAGEDPVLLAKLARETDPLGLTRTIAQKTGSPALAAIESKLAEYSARFSRESKSMADDSLETIHRLFRALHNTGDPQALVAAAKIRNIEFNHSLVNKLSVTR